MATYTYTCTSTRTESKYALNIGSAEAVVKDTIDEALAAGIVAYNAVADKDAEATTPTIFITPLTRPYTIESVTTYSVDATTGKITSASTARTVTPGTDVLRTAIPITKAFRGAIDGRRSGAAGDGGAIQHTRAEQPDAPDGGQPDAPDGGQPDAPDGGQ